MHKNRADKIHNAVISIRCFIETNMLWSIIRNDLNHKVSIMKCVSSMKHRIYPTVITVNVTQSMSKTEEIVHVTEDELEDLEQVFEQLVREARSFLEGICIHIQESIFLPTICPHCYYRLLLAPVGCKAANVRFRHKDAT